MRIWKVKVKPTWDVPFLATRGRALKALENDEVGWTLQKLFGLYVQSYEKKFRYRRWRLSEDKGMEIVQSLRLLVRRVKMDEARKAVVAVFALKFANWDHHRMLSNSDTYEQWVAPQIFKTDDEKRGKGEQAEWTGSRDGKSGAMSAKEFFES